MPDISKIKSLDGLTTYNLRDSNLNGHTVNSDVPSNAEFTDTTYESKSAASGGTEESLVTTGEKYTWNNKLGSESNLEASKLTGSIPSGVMSQTIFAICDTAADVVNKEATLTDFTLSTGALVLVCFEYTNTAANPTLNVNNTGAYPMYKYGSNAIGNQVQESWHTGAIVSFIFDGSHWVVCDYGYRDMATTIKNGLMSAADKTKVDALGNVGNLSYTVVSTW